MHGRRRALKWLATVAAVAFAADAQAGPRRRRKVRRRIRRRVRRRIRRRIRRHAAWRVIGTRRALVVPVAAVVGWELALAGAVVTVHEFKKVTIENQPRDVMVVIHADGKKEEVEIHREDTDENRKELEGTTMAAAVPGVPSREVETEVEVEEDAPQ